MVGFKGAALRQRGDSMVEREKEKGGKRRGREEKEGEGSGWKRRVRGEYPAQSPAGPMILRQIL